MSTIPSQSVASVLQSTLAQRTAAAERDAETQRAAATSRETAALDDKRVNAVEDTDADTRVHADSGGLGSRGRSFDEPPADENPDAEPPAAPGPDPLANQLDVTA